VIRRAVPQDCTTVGQIAEEAGPFPAAALPEMIAPYFAGEEGQHWLVAQGEAGPAGFCYCAPERFTDATFNLLAIASQQRGAGIGKRLIGALEAELSAAGARLLLVETSSQPQFAPTQAFYRSAGFSHVATVPDYWTAGDDKIIFSKPIGRTGA
jgi:ribosomal protein S18 acetylase RimI-like enzyme